MRIRITPLTVALCLAVSFGLGKGACAYAQALVTNGNGGATDVGTWYSGIWCTNPPGPCNQWSGNGSFNNNLPLVNWTMVSGSPSYRSGMYQIYDSSSSTVIADDMASLAAAQIDFILLDMTNGGLGGVAPGNNWTATYAGAILTGAANWNAAHTWKIRVAFAIGDYFPGTAGAIIEAQAQDVWNNFVNNATYGTPTNWYQINTKPLLVLYNTTTQADWNAYCAGGGTCTYGNKFQFEFANNQGAGQWGWFLRPAGTQVDPAGVVAQVSPGWIGYPTGSPVDPRNDGHYYQNNWNVVFANRPRIAILTAFNDWGEQQDFWINDTASSPYTPTPPQTVNGSGGGVRPVEVFTLPDENVTLDGYWNYTVAAINYLRNGGAAPFLPQPAVDVAESGTATASSTLGGFSTASLNDGNPSTAWISQRDASANSTEWVQIHMPSNPIFNTVVLMGRGDIPYCFPVDFQIQVWNGSQWLTRVQETNFPQPVIPGTPIAFTWGFNDQTTDVRVLATKLSADNTNTGSYYFQLGEFEVANEGSIATIPVFANWGFEAPAQGGTDDSATSYTYGPFTNGWTFNANAGVQQVGSAWHSFMPPQGLQTAFLQGPSSSISQSITLPAGTYVIRFLASQRSTEGGLQGISVLYDSTVIKSIPSPIPNNWTPYVTNTFTSTGGSHTITFNGVNTGDSTAFLDEVQIFKH
jgi:F5/8 type C domain-containing protein